MAVIRDDWSALQLGILSVDNAESLPDVIHGSCQIVKQVPGIRAGIGGHAGKCISVESDHQLLAGTKSCQRGVIWIVESVGLLPPPLVTGLESVSANGPAHVIADAFHRVDSFSPSTESADVAERG